MLGGQWSLLWIAVAVLFVRHYWTNASDAPPGLGVADGFAPSRTRSVRAAVCLVAAQCGRATTLRYQTARGCPMSMCWSQRIAARSRVPDRKSVSDDAHHLA